MNYAQRLVIYSFLVVLKMTAHLFTHSVIEYEFDATNPTGPSALCGQRMQLQRIYIAP